MISVSGVMKKGTSFAVEITTTSTPDRKPMTISFTFGKEANAQWLHELVTQAGTIIIADKK